MVLPSCFSDLEAPLSFTSGSKPPSIVILRVEVDFLLLFFLLMQSRGDNGDSFCTVMKTIKDGQITGRGYLEVKSKMKKIM